MQFDQTKTYLNLARGFAGESQAGMRYQLIARAALKQGYEELANVIKTIAKNETVHARRFFEELTKRGGDCIENIDIDAGYPFHMGDIGQALKFAAKDEREEHERIYSTFAKEAKEEGFDDVAALFNLVANVEKRHEQVFTYLANAFETGTLYKNESPILYVCADCGYMQTATRAWDICPLCKASQGEVYLHIPYEKEKL
ncbi:MAG TPA: rubrerythrin family protein [Candidatus Coproplasma excrementipullorum]|nr:rubrerythrin family protein [Candidatus Coproplasma excrementipullorum]